MQLTRLMDVRCPSCDKALGVHDTILQDIFRHLQATSTDVEYLTLVCPACKVSFQFDYRRRSEKAMGLTEILDQTLEPLIWFPVVGECEGEFDGSNCDSQKILFAIRDRNTTQTAFLAEIPTWNLSGLLCEHRHPIVKASLMT
jgi:phage FluMu protein Com